MKAKNIIKQFFTNHIKLIAKLLFFMILNIAFVIACPIFVKVFISQIEAIAFLQNESLLNDARIALVIYAILLSISIVGALIFPILRNDTSHEFGNKLSTELKEAAFSAYLRADYSETEKLSKEDVKNKILQDSSKIGRVYYGDHLINLIYTFALTVASLIVTFIYDAIIGLVCLISAAILYLSVGALEKLRAKRIEKWELAKTKQDASLSQTIDNYKNIKIRNGLTLEEEKYNKVVEKEERRHAKLIKLTAMTEQALYYILYVITLLIAIGLATYNYYIGEVEEVNVYVAVAFSSGLFFMYLKTCYTIFFDKQNMDATYESINKIFDLKQENRSENSPTIDEVYSLRFNNVSYVSETHKNYGVHNVDFEVKNGESLAILGISESTSKTIIADLITKIIKPTNGSITINNCDLMKINSNELRNIITYVPQNFTLIDDTIEANIIYPYQLDEYKYNEVLNKCGIKDILMNLPERDKQKVSEAKLSESDTQKIILANALYKDSKVIVLDNAFLHLDEESANAIRDEFYKLKNKILIISTQNIHTAVSCDKVLMMSQNNVLTYGKVEDLLADNKSVLSKVAATAGIR